EQIFPDPRDHGDTAEAVLSATGDFAVRALRETAPGVEAGLLPLGDKPAGDEAAGAAPDLSDALVDDVEDIAEAADNATENTATDAVAAAAVGATSADAGAGAKVFASSDPALS